MSGEGEALQAHRALADALEQALRRRDPGAWPEPLPDPPQVERIETHISTLLLAGDGALKLKKPLAPGFLDFSTLALRERFCREELRINRRTAPALYRDVLPITGSVHAPRVGGDGPVLDWALWMRRFDNTQLYDRLARRGALTAAHVDALAAVVAAFHAALPPSPPTFGDPAVALAANRDTLAALADPALASGLSLAAREQLARLATWCVAQGAELAPRLAARRAQGAVVEGHGDLHLGNIVHHEGRPLLFDAIEFDPALRHIDRAADLAFTFMDLLDHGLPRLAWRFLGGVLEAGGDFEALPLLRWFAADRALVRAKVALIGAQQRPAPARDESLAVAAHRIALAHALAFPAPAPLLWVGGLSGSGKSTVALALAQALGAVRVRSDVERKRLHGLAAIDRPADPATIYNPDSNARTYARLAEVARLGLAGEIPVVVDAALLHRAEREQLRQVARAAGRPCLGLWCSAPESVLRERLARRQAQQRDASDADAAVLALQLRVHTAPAADEDVRVLDTDRPLAALVPAAEQALQGWGLPVLPD
ncbi:MAG: AAA family ATPase [Rubrivivax sp.]|nr:AAA family ATPase [Rubrivivax sp.]